MKLSTCHIIQFWWNLSTCYRHHCGNIKCLGLLWSQDRSSRWVFFVLGARIIELYKAPATHCMAACIYSIYVLIWVWLWGLVSDWSTPTIGGTVSGFRKEDLEATSEVSFGTNYWVEYLNSVNADWQATLSKARSHLSLTWHHWWENVVQGTLEYGTNKGTKISQNNYAGLYLVIIFAHTVVLPGVGNRNARQGKLFIDHWHKPYIAARCNQKNNMVAAMQGLCQL